MVRFCLVTLAFAALALAAPQPQLSPDPNGAKNVGNGQGAQFIPGGCLSDADCASGCCAGLASGEAVCSGPDVGNVNGKQGCGFNGGGNGGDANNDDGDAAADEDDGRAADAGGAGGAGNADTGAAGSENAGLGDGSQFITGQCSSDADCASGCCAGSEGSDTAACSAVLAANESGKTGCGFGS